MRETDKAKADAIEVRNKYQLELLNNIRILKMYNWESVVSENTLNARDHELNLLYRILMINTIMHTFIGGAHFFINFSMVTSMSLWGIVLYPGMIFAA